ncbi:MAG: IS6 family transposase [Coxiellaceae bacterium]|nr:IS6 family transposase [Coxiellaceae bacterium]
MNQYQCRHCVQYFNERSSTLYNHTQYPTDIITMVMFFYYRYKLSLIDITEIMALRNVCLSYETVRRWVQKFGTDLALKCRTNRNRVGTKWHMDITYCTIKGNWYYLYRAIDKAGNLVDVYLSETRDKKAALRFFKQCHQITSVTPEQITTNKESGFSDAIQTVFGQSTIHRDVKYLNNRMEQNHRGIKSWYRPMKGFKSPWPAMILCHAFEEIRQFFRSQHPLSKHRSLIASKFREFRRLAICQA